jgi:uncharacterized alkaline shock family protein YloU
MTKGTYNYENLILYCNDNNIILLQQYDNIKVTRDTLINGKCNNLDCNNNFNKTFRQLKKSKNYCNLCTKINTKIKVENTCLLKYGVKSIFNSTEMKKIMKDAIMEKYGVDNISKSNEIKHKKEITCLKNYGVSVSFKSPEIKETIKQSYLKNSV